MDDNCTFCGGTGNYWDGEEITECPYCSDEDNYLPKDWTIEDTQSGYEGKYPHKDIDEEFKD